jgi:succinyl-diaminopimelate desuccinylase
LADVNSATLDLISDLISRDSVTPRDGGCQEVLIKRLEAIGFDCERMPFGEVTNLWATRQGKAGGPVLAFAGHTDVVPPGPLEQWRFPPFQPTQADGLLYGRGAADMKTSVAAFTVAAEEFVNAHPDFSGTLALLITSDEEGPSVNGTCKVVEALRARGTAIDYCIVGEPTSVGELGDMIKNGRRGTLSGRLSVRGVQGHVAYPHLARNPVHEALPALAELVAMRFDEGNAYYLPTTLQISNTHAGTGAGNVIPGLLVVDFNLRFSTESTVDQLKQRIGALFDRHAIDYTIEWTLGGMPFLTAPGALSEALSRAIFKETGVKTELSTSGGTSDGRFIATLCRQVIEFGPPNATIHKIDEHVALRFIEPLKNIYRDTIEALLPDATA